VGYWCRPLPSLGCPYLPLRVSPVPTRWQDVAGENEGVMTEPEAIPVLTLWQPWASLVALINPETGLPWKTIETRSWATNYRGPLAIHAAARPPCSYQTDTWVGNWKAHRRIGDGGYDLTLYQARRPELSDELWRGALDMVELPLGAIVATCTLVDVVQIVPYRLDQSKGRPHVMGYRDGSALWLNKAVGTSLSLTDQLPYGDYRTPPEVDQRYAWMLAGVVPVDPPVPLRGGQGLTRRWTPSAAVA
jgi:activating signal cointegrator 1